MATITTDILAEEVFHVNGKENGAPADSGQGMALAPLVDKIAHGIARGLVVAMKELETHIATETRKVGDSVGRRLDMLQASLQDLTDAATEQRSFNISIQERCQELAAEDLRQETALATLRTETKDTAAAILERVDTVAGSLQDADSRHQADLATLCAETKETAAAISGRVDTVAGSLQDADLRQQADLATLRAETKETAAAISGRVDTVAGSLQDADSRQQAELVTLRTEAKESVAAIAGRIDTLCQELFVHQEDIAAIKSTLSGFSKTVEGVVERLDRQADALRTMCAAYAQRETELESLVDGLARLRAYPAPAPVDPRL
jgi:chromosome segregation ATPase